MGEGVLSHALHEAAVEGQKDETQGRVSVSTGGY